MENRELIARAYCDAIKRHYTNLPERAQREVVNDLEVLLLQHYAPGVLREAEETIVPRQTGFDNKIAKKLRIDAGLTQKQLSVLLANSPEWQGEISRYENSRISSSRLNAGKLSKESTGFGHQYLQWLKSRGYDPFNLGGKPQDD